MISPRETRALSVACLTVIAAMSLACPGPEPTDNGADLFRVAVNGAPIGSLLAVWGDPNARRAVMVGGFVGVPRDRLNGAPAGRLVEYRDGAFTTRCTADEVLWWVDGTYEGGSALVYAVGENGKVLRFDGARCEEVRTGITFDEGPVTYWGVLVRAPNDVWLVGGSAQPTGPRGVVVRFDGARWTRVTDLPARARDENLYKVARAGADVVVVGSGAVVMRGRNSALEMVTTDARGSDNRLFTASCTARGYCYAVGGAASGMLLTGALDDPDAGLRASSVAEDLPGLNGVWVQDPENVFLVGTNGANVHTTGPRRFVGRASTAATLHGVGGWTSPAGNVVLAVGGELGVATAAQRAVILVRGEDRSTFTLDGTLYTASGELRRSLGGSGQ